MTKNTKHVRRKHVDVIQKQQVLFQLMLEQARREQPIFYRLKTQLELLVETFDDYVDDVLNMLLDSATKKTLLLVEYFEKALDELANEQQRVN